MSEAGIVERFLGFDPIAVVAYPSGYGVLYTVVILLAVALGIGVGIRMHDLKAARRARGWLVGAVLVSVLGYSVIRQSLVVEYVGQGVPFTGEPSTGNLVVPLPFPGLRSAAFAASYSPGEAIYPRTPAAEMRSIVFAPENLLGTYVTMLLHLLSFAALLFSLCALFVLGSRFLFHHFTGRF
jgi:hypothetical protein